jgi:hypothetical protein
MVKVVGNTIPTLMKNVGKFARNVMVKDTQKMSAPIVTVEVGQKVNPVKNVMEKELDERTTICGSRFLCGSTPIRWSKT